MRLLNILYLSLITITLLATGCAPIYETQYTYQPPHTDLGRMCAAQCLQTQNTCQQMCQMRNQTCELNSKQNAKMEYHEYKKTQMAAGKSVDRTVSDFDHSYGCNEPCDCTGVYNQCYQTCGGIVMPLQVCTAFCDKK